jgi:predicted Abi (CAAX) family protease
MQPFASTRLGRSLVTRPGVADWGRCGAVAALSLCLIAAVALPSGLAHWHPAFAGWPLRLARVMLVPAFTEELVFRGLLTPGRGEERPVLWLAGGLALFVAWHVVEALTFLPGAHLFLTAPFLVCAGMLGAACAYMRYHTGSLWPALAFHGLTVFLWQAAFGGPDVARLLSKA